MIKFGEWLPDQPDLDTAGVTVAHNVIPALSGYRSLNSLNAVSNAGDAPLKGIFASKDNAGNVKLFAGNASKLYEFTASNSNLTSVGKVGGYSLTDGEYWNFIQYGTSVIACGGDGETLQEFTLGSDTAFADLSNAPKAKFIAVVRDQVWVANADDGSGVVPYRAIWSGVNDATSWTSGTDQSDFQDIPDAGAITGLVGGEYAIILMEKAICRATYMGTPLIYQIDKMETTRGCAFSGSVGNIGRLVFYLSEDGFYTFDGSMSSPIGAEKINKYFFNDFNQNYAHKMTCAVDPTNQVVAWSYISNSNSSATTPDKLLMYNYSIQRWSIAEVDADLISPLYTSGYTTEGLDNLGANLDSLTTQLDSPLYKGSTFLFGGSLANKIYSFTGSPLTGIIETSEFSVTKGKHSIINRIVPYYKNGTITTQIGVRDTQAETVTYSTTGSLSDDGFIPHRSQGKFHRIRMNISGNWDYAQGVDIEGQPLGKR